MFVFMVTGNLKVRMCGGPKRHNFHSMFDEYRSLGSKLLRDRHIYIYNYTNIHMDITLLLVYVSI
jgi:hypothetical protein